MFSSRSSFLHPDVLFFIQLETRCVCLAGITPYPDQQWMEQQARNETMKHGCPLSRSPQLVMNCGATPVVDLAGCRIHS